MQLISILLVGAGFCSLVAGWFFSRSYLNAGENIRLARSIISKIEHLPIEHHSNECHTNGCILTLSFSSPEGTLFHHREHTRQSTTWYKGMPLLIRYRFEAGQVSVIQVQTYQQAYGKAFAFLLTGILLIVCGAILL